MDAELTDEIYLAVLLVVGEIPKERGRGPWPLSLSCRRQIEKALIELEVLPAECAHHYAWHPLVARIVERIDIESFEGSAYDRG